jgi:hypothetical protein
MDEYEVDAPINEIIRWIREDAARNTPRLLVRASKGYTLESDVDREAFGIGEDEDVDAVSVHGILEVQSRTGRKDWALQLKVDEVMGIISTGGENVYEDVDDMTLAAFEEQFLATGLGEVEATVAAETPEAKTRFDRWLARRMKARRP